MNDTHTNPRQRLRFQSTRGPVVPAFALAVLALCLAIAGGCGGGGGGSSNNNGSGGNPVGPSAVNVSGSWKGTWSYMVNGLRGSESVTGSFNQSGANATGQLTAESGVSLNFTLDLSGALKGNSTLYSYGYGQSCSATGAVTGEASEGRLVLRVAAPSSTACSWQGTENELTLSR